MNELERIAYFIASTLKRNFSGQVFYKYVQDLYVEDGNKTENVIIPASTTSVYRGNITVWPYDSTDEVTATDGKIVLKLRWKDQDIEFDIYTNGSVDGFNQPFTLTNVLFESLSITCNSDDQKYFYQFEGTDLKCS